MARQLTQLVAGSARLDSAHFNFFMSWTGSLARYFNKPARELLTSWGLSAYDHNPEDYDANLEVYTYSIGM